MSLEIKLFFRSDPPIFIGNFEQLSDAILTIGTHDIIDYLLKYLNPLKAHNKVLVNFSVANT